MYGVTATQFMQPAQVTMMRPAQATVTSAQTTGLDITGLINSILPLFMLMMVMGMIDTQSHHFEAPPQAGRPAR